MLHDAVCVRISLMFFRASSFSLSLFPSISFLRLILYRRLHLCHSRPDHVTKNCNYSPVACEELAKKFERGPTGAHVFLSHADIRICGCISLSFVWGEKNTRSMSISLQLSLHMLSLWIVVADTRRCLFIGHWIELRRTLDRSSWFYLSRLKNICNESKFLRSVRGSTNP